MLICAAELTTAYKVVKHHQSFSSLDCTTKLNAVMYPDSSIAAKQSTARTKATAIIKHILAPHSIAQIKTEVEKVPFYGISTDSSNHKAEKLFPLLIQYFTEKEGLQIKLLKIDSLPNETSDTITSFCIKSLQDQNIPVQNIVAFSGDNTNTNFGGRDSQAFLIEKQIKKIEKSVITIVEVKNVLQDTKKQLSDRLINKYLGNQTTQLYNKLKNEGTINTSQSETFDKETGDFFNTAICYLEQWTEPMTKFDVFAWMILNDIPQWQQVEETTKYLNEKDIGIDDSMYEEFMYLKSFIECEISDEWKAKNMEAKWKHFF
ncbi:unnamed protein product [Parnassius apollo]|uniref:(apollo) hypothetical protein n=1 Tax=Parnassius apollo TaxID=110799 RepID=A0A8S3WFS1_PARAO|nr:unnamed protein product [Parnassius apollo]